ncbi:MAG TPA: HD domain-containing protein [Desulfosalsimonadaceae bacterium]|nr:HD domain-containing protein [Desulfosalsimonadaceae bacterium]
MKCPGQDSRYWKPSAIFEVDCPECNRKVEFFKDDTTRRCPHCRHQFVNPHMDFGCAAYCKFAEHCIGNMPPELLAERDELLKDRIAIETKKYFKSDFKRIGHATRVARHAEKIGATEGGDMAVIMAAAYLHDIGIHEAEKKYDSTAARYQEQEGPPIARGILEKLNAADGLIEEVCDIIGHHHHPREEETQNFKVVYDADLIANLTEKHKENPIAADHAERITENQFYTETGKSIARQSLL